MLYLPSTHAPIFSCFLAKGQKKELQVKADAHETIESLEDKIEEKTKYPAGSILFSFKDQLLNKSAFSFL